MFCENCGSKINGKQEFCGNCGAKTNETLLLQSENVKRKVIVIIVLVFAVIIGIGVILKDRTVSKPNDTKKDEKDQVIEFVSEEELEAYFQNTVVEEIGAANIEPSAIVVSARDEKEAEECSKLQGILGYKILDLDNDERLELLVLHTDDYRNIATVYEKENGKIVLKSEQMISDMCKERDRSSGIYYAANYATNYWIINSVQGIFLVYTHNWQGVYGDAYDAEILIWKYDGENILPVMNIDQGGLGSAYFSYTSYKYDEEGMESSKEVIYREEEMEGPAIFDADGSTLARQFAEYGIEINTDVKLMDSIGALERLFSDNVEKEELCTLKMWIESDYQTWQNTLHFNDEAAINHMNME